MIEPGCGPREELNLTEENKRELRALVNALTRDLPQEPPSISKLHGVDWAADPWGVRRELDAMVSRAFVPKMVVEIYNSSPLMGPLLKQAGKVRKQAELDKLDGKRRRAMMRGWK